MAEQEQQVSEQQPTESIQEQAPVEISIEDKARELGWRPKEEYSGSKPWRSAETFLELQPFYEEIGSLKKSFKQVREEQDRDRENNRRFMEEHKAAAVKAAEAHFNQQLAALREEKKLALREGETDRVVELDDQMADLREQKKQSTQVEMPQRITPDPAEAQAKINAFVERNKWYESDEDMRDWANARAVSLQRKGIGGDDALKEIEKQVKEVFPQKFRNSNRDKPSAVEGSAAAGSVSKSIPNDMSSFEREIMKNVLAVTPTMTEAQYIKEWKKAGGR